MIEAVEGLRFIDTTLRNNSGFMSSIPGGLYHALNTKLQTGVFPDDIFCVYQHQAGSDDLGGGGYRIGTSNVYVVRYVGPGSNLEGIETAAGLGDALLHQASGTTATGIIYYLLRESANMLPEVINNRLVLSAVHQYRSYVQKAGS